MKYKLIIFDMDGVIFEHHNFWMQLHKVLGTYEEGVVLTKKYKETNYQKLVDEVVGRLWKGLDATPYFDLVKSFKYVPGAKETLKELKNRGYKTAIISSSAKHEALRVQEECGLDFFHTYDVLIEGNKFTGEYVWDTAHTDKSDHLKKFANLVNCTLQETVYVGHSHNDVAAIKLAGLGVAFCSEEKEVLQAADKIIKEKNLTKLLTLLP